jgi:hypothetical protein
MWPSSHGAIHCRPSPRWYSIESALLHKDREGRIEPLCNTDNDFKPSERCRCVEEKKWENFLSIDQILTCFSILYSSCSCSCSCSCSLLVLLLLILLLFLLLLLLLSSSSLSSSSHSVLTFSEIVYEGRGCETQAPERLLDNREGESVQCDDIRGRAPWRLHYTGTLLFLFVSLFFLSFLSPKIIILFLLLLSRVGWCRHWRHLDGLWGLSAFRRSDRADEGLLHWRAQQGMSECARLYNTVLVDVITTMDLMVFELVKQCRRDTLLEYWILFEWEFWFVAIMACEWILQRTLILFSLWMKKL